MVSANVKQGSERVISWRRVPLLFLLMLLLSVDLAIATFLEIDSGEAAGLVIGSMFAQITVAAAWIALGPMSIFSRVMIGASLISVATLSMFVCALRDAGNDAIAFVLAGAMLAQAVIYQVPLWVVRFQGWQLTLLTAAQQSDRQKEFQFGLSQLLIWTTAVAVFLAAGRFLLSGFSVKYTYFNGETIGVFAVLSLFNVLLAFPIIWGCFVRRLVWLWMVIAAVWCCILTPAELGVLGMFGPTGDHELFVLANPAQVIAAAMVLLCARLAGLRLRHRDLPIASG